jgi:hypothetical protein
MMGLLQKLKTPAQRLRAARIAFASLAALALVAVLVFGTVMLVAPRSDSGHAYGKVERGDSYLVYTVPEVPIDGVARGHWSTLEGKNAPDTIRIIAYSDLGNLLAGRPLAYPHREVTYAANPCRCSSWGGWDNLPWHGYAEVRYIDSDGRYAFCGSCQDPRLTLVWTRGTAWQGAEVTHGAWTLDAEGQPQGDAPILWRGIVNEHNFLDWFGVMLGALLTLGALTVAAGGWLAAETLLARRARRDTPPPAPPLAGTEDLLRLVQLSERYLAALTGYFLAGGLVVLLGVAVVSYLAVPALLQSAHDHFFDPFYADIPILLLGPFLAVVALTLWGLAFQRVRRERARWRRLGAEFGKFTDAVLES